MKEITKSSSLIPFLNQKNNVNLKYNKDSMIERKEVFVNDVQSVNENDLTAICIISTQNVDRTGDVVLSNGIMTDEFKQIPSIYVNHNYATLPIAKCLDIVHKSGMIEAKIQFVKEDELSMKVFNLVKNGVMRGISIGFDAEEVILKGSKVFDETCKSLNMDVSSYQKTHRIISKWNLYEFSVVSIPANAECMVKSLEVKENDEANKANEEAEKPNTDVGSSKSNETEEKPKKTEEVKEVKELSEGAKVEMEDHKDIYTYLKELGIEEDKIKEVFEMIAKDELAKDPNFYKKENKTEDEANETPKEEEEEEEQKSIVMIKEVEKPVVKVIPQVKRYIQILQTPEDIKELVSKSVEARIKGKTRIVIV
jgi:phage head maturation protease